MSLMTATWQAFCDPFSVLAWDGEAPTWDGEAPIKKRTGNRPDLPEREQAMFRTSSMTTKSTHWTGDFAMQRRPLLLMRAKNVCRNATDAEDLVQDTIVRFIQSFGSIGVPPEPRVCEAWLMRVLQNLFIDQCRKRKVQDLGAKEPSLSNEVAAPEPAADTVFDAITPEQISEALDNLSPKLRETFKLHLSGKKYLEITEILGIPMGTVAKRMHDARHKLHKLLARLSPSPGDLS